jgi:hypothetical protein
MSRRMMVPLKFLTLSTDPLVGSVGEVYVNTVTKNLRVHNGTTWIDLTPGSTDPAPFYMHTHTYDGDVHTINLQETIDFSSINENSSIEETLPVIIGVDGGSPNSNYSNASYTQLTLLDGGEIA